MEIDHRPQLRADDDLRAICREIVAHGRSLSEWDIAESDDMFQRGVYVGGYEAVFLLRRREKGMVVDLWAAGRRKDSPRRRVLVRPL